VLKRRGKGVSKLRKGNARVALGGHFAPVLSTCESKQTYLFHEEIFCWNHKKREEEKKRRRGFFSESDLGGELSFSDGLLTLTVQGQKVVRKGEKGSQ